MYAVSLVGAVGRIDNRGQRLLERNTLAQADIVEPFHDAQRDLCDIAELLASHRPFRLGSHDEPVATAVRAVLEAQYETGRRVRASAFDEETVALARDAGAVVRGSWLFVPLGRNGPVAKNWRPVFAVLVDRLDDVRESYGQLRKRLRGSAGTERALMACETVIEMLAVLQRTLDQLTAIRDYVSHRTDHDQTELLAAVERKAAALSGDTDA